jgi:hypothetical protein
MPETFSHPGLTQPGRPVQPLEAGHLQEDPSFHFDEVVARHLALGLPLELVGCAACFSRLAH